MLQNQSENTTNMRDIEDFYGKHYTIFLCNIKYDLIKRGDKIYSWLRILS